MSLFPGHFGFFWNKNYYVVSVNDSRQEVLGKKIVNELRNAIMDKTFKTWIPKIKNIKLDYEGHVESLSDILEKGIMKIDSNESKIPNFENYSYIVNFDTMQLNFYHGYRVLNNYYFDLDMLPNW